MNNKCHQYQSHQNSDVKEIEQKKSDLRVPMSHMSHWNHPYSQNRQKFKGNINRIELVFNEYFWWVLSVVS